MTVLQELLDELKGDDNTDIVRQMCDRIAKEEKRNIENHLSLPQGPNIFLALEVPGRTKTEIAFLCLERENEDKYLAVMFVKPKRGNKPLKRQRVWEINDHRPVKILTEYAMKYKFLRGE